MGKLQICLDIGEQFGETKGEIYEHLLYCVESDDPIFIDIKDKKKDGDVDIWEVHFYSESDLDYDSWYGGFFLYLLGGKMINISEVNGKYSFKIIF